MLSIRAETSHVLSEVLSPSVWCFCRHARSISTWHRCAYFWLVCLEGHSANSHSPFAFLNILGITSHFKPSPVNSSAWKTVEKYEILNLEQRLPKARTKMSADIQLSKKKRGGVCGIFNIKENWSHNKN